MAGSEIKVMWERILNYTITEQKTSNIHEFLKAHGYSSSLIRAIKEDPEGIHLNGEPVLVRTLLSPVTGLPSGLPKQNSPKILFRQSASFNRI